MSVQTSKLFRIAGDDRNWVGFTIETGYMMFPAGKDGWSQRRPFRELDSSVLLEVPAHLSFNTGFPLAKAEQTQRIQTRERQAAAAASAR